MKHTSAFPGKYIQGINAINDLESIVFNFGSKAIILTSASAGKYLPARFKEQPLAASVTIEAFGGECSEAELSSFSRCIKDTGSDVIVGMGGGKVIDTAKIAADRAGLPVIIVPTIAATDAPCSGCAVIYSPEGVFEKVYYQRLNPQVVLVDDAIIAKAPVRFLVSGMGDALATWFEARSCKKNSSNNECGGLSTLAGLHIAKLCYDTLLGHGVQAIHDHRAGIVGASLSNIIEANILLSGIGFESGGIASAHAIHNGLTALPETHGFYHGEKVAFGLLAGLQMIGSPEEEIDEVYRFCCSVGLPVSFSDIGIKEVTREKLMLVAQKTMEPGSSIYHEGQITAEMVFDALIKADAYNREKRKTKAEETHIL